IYRRYSRRQNTLLVCPGQVVVVAKPYVDTQTRRRRNGDCAAKRVRGSVIDNALSVVLVVRAVIAGLERTAPRQSMVYRENIRIVVGINATGSDELRELGVELLMQKVSRQVEAIQIVAGVQFE